MSKVSVEEALFCSKLAKILLPAIPIKYSQSAIDIVCQIFMLLTVRIGVN
jgi:hypothetical protein